MKLYRTWNNKPASVSINALEVADKVDQLRSRLEALKDEPTRDTVALLKRLDAELEKHGDGMLPVYRV